MIKARTTTVPGPWNLYHAGVAAFLAGREREACGYFTQLGGATNADGPPEARWLDELRGLARSYAQRCLDRDEFRAHLAAEVQRSRVGLKLPPVEDSLRAGDRQAPSRCHYNVITWPRRRASSGSETRKAFACPARCWGGPISPKRSNFRARRVASSSGPLAARDPGLTRRVPCTHAARTRCSTSPRQRGSRGTSGRGSEVRDTARLQEMFSK
jgi:hypothetical protein